MSDTSSTTACPDAATLRALLDGTLPDAQQGATQAHVDRCPTCEAALRQMTAGGESWIGMVEKLKGSGEEDPKLAAALERLKADDGSGGESSGSATDPQRTLDFLQPADDPKLLGKLGRHEISEVVGWGGMGVVLKAYDPSLHRVVAVKVLASHLAHHAVARKRFIREAQAAAAVCHDNVVTIHAIEEGVSGTALAAGVGDQPFSTSPAASAVPLTKGALPKIIMQFVAGGSLQERIDQEAPLELKEILRIAMQTAAGLAAAHAQGVVHRDVKPANILLENGVQRVKLTDFGLARVMDDASLTLSGVIAGTPQYMAPEQAWGREVDARADLFSLGAVMYAMCSGHSPFRARTTMAVLKRVCEQAPRPLRAINPDIPEWLVAIIEKLLAKNPDDRFQSAKEVSELLGRWLAHVQQPTVVPAPARVHSPSSVVPLPDQTAADTATVSRSVSPVASPSLSNSEKIFMALSIVGAAIPLLCIGLFYLMVIPGMNPQLLDFVVLFLWLQFFSLAASTAVNLHRKSLEVIPTVIQCVALCLTVYFIPVAIHGFLLLRKRMNSEDPSTARAGQVENLPHDQAVPGRLSLKQTHWPVLFTAVALSVCFVLILNESGSRNLGSYFGFCLVHLALTFALCSAFYSAWNSSSWVVWSGVMLFLPVASGTAFLTSSNGSVAQKVLNTVQLVVAFGCFFALLFIRPLFVRGSGKWKSERLTGWQQLFAIACFTIIGTPLVFLMMYELSYSPRPVPTAPQATISKPILVVPFDELDKSNRKPNGFPKPMLLTGDSNLELDPPALPGMAAKTAMIPDSLKALLGRWVVVSSEGAQLSALPKSNSPVGSEGVDAASGGAAPQMGAGGIGYGMPGMMGGVSETAPLQWIEFAEDQVLAFDGRERKLHAKITVDAEPIGISLKIPSAIKSSHGSVDVVLLDWRQGIIRVERDRLIICWTSPGNLGQVPTEFATSRPGSQLLVLRREWSPGPEFHPRETPPPRAVVPFTVREGKLLQDAWAGSADVAVETTNSLGMKLRLIPPGTFDPIGYAALEGIGVRPAGASHVFSQPIYLGATEVSVAQFGKFVEATQYQTTAEQLPLEANPDRRTWRSPGIVQESDDHPVVHVSWQDAQAFCRWLSDTEQQQYRLPTIAEWAFAMRAGLESTSKIKPPHNARLRFFDKTAPVGSGTANLFGLYHLHGNVGEWMSDIAGNDDDVRLSVARRNYYTVVLGGGFQTKFEGGEIQESLLFQIREQLLHHQADVGFRVARVVTHEVETLSGYWPSVEALIATPTQAGVPMPSNATKPDDPKTPTKDADKTPTTQLPVVSLRGVVPTGAFPLAVKFVDFELERATQPTKKREFGEYSETPPDTWKKVDLKFSQEILERVGFNEGDWAPALHRDPALTVPLPKFQPPWLKEFALHPYLPVAPMKSKYEVRHQLFRYFDFEVTPGNSYAYRVRLKFTPSGKQEPPQVIATPWSYPSAWAAVEKPQEEKEN